MDWQEKIDALHDGLHFDSTLEARRSVGIEFFTAAYENYISLYLVSDCASDKDGEVLDAIKYRNRPHEERLQEVVAWLRNRYHVLMGFTSQEGVEIANEILDFADSYPVSGADSSNAEIFGAFVELESRLGKLAPRNQSGTARGITSLTSKALWLCFPDDVPIFDSNAFSALCMLRWLLELPSSTQSSEYGAFVETWKTVFNLIKPRGKYMELPCNMLRAFDHWLWHLGNRSLHERDTIVL
jgi:hypothetical protein